MRELKTEAECRLLYADVVNGYSAVQDFFIKHYSEADLSYTEFIRCKFEEEGRKEGLLCEKDQLLLLQEKDNWSKQEEVQYQEAKTNLDQLKFSLKKLIIPQQINHMKGMIEKEEKEFNEKFQVRRQLLGMTLEQYANKRAAENHILRAFFKDINLTIPRFSEEQIDDLSNQSMDIYIDIYHQTHSAFYEKNFKRIAVCPFFLNGYSLSEENPFIFFGKPIVSLTLYQISLFSKGRYYQNILSEPEAKHPPEEYYEDLDSVVKFYDQQYSIILGKRTNNQLMRA